MDGWQRRNPKHSRTGRTPFCTDRENAVLRIILKKWMEKLKLSQIKAGERLGVGQQAVGTILNGGGFSRPTASKLAATQGYNSAEALLEAEGALAQKPTRPATWADRELAVGLARRAGYAEAVLERVVARYSESQFLQRPTKWWMDRIAQTSAEMEDELRDTVPRAASSSAVPASSTVPAATESSIPAKPKPKRGKRGAA